MGCPIQLGLEVAIRHIIIKADELKRLAIQLFEVAGVAREEAAIVAESLVASNLAGHDSHGVVRIWEYVRQLRKGDLVAGAELNTLSEAPGVLVTDAQFGFGQVQMQRLIERLLPKAQQQGVACATMLNSGHVGRLGQWVDQMAQHGVAALMAVNDNGVLQCVAPPGGIDPRISTNPIAIAVPTGDEPLVLDISTSAAANGKILVHHKANRECPSDWLQDADGNPTTDPSVRFRDPRGTILPMGGSQGFKGFGLGLLFDILVGGLSGGSCPPAPDGSRMTNNVMLVAWNPESFSGQSHFLSEANELIDYVRTSNRKPSVDQIRLPNDRSRELTQQRLENGISLDDGTYKSLTAIAAELGVAITF